MRNQREQRLVALLGAFQLAELERQRAERRQHGGITRVALGREHELRQCLVTTVGGA
jgi:hypothetical protein